MVETNFSGMDGSDEGVADHKDKGLVLSRSDIGSPPSRRHLCLWTGLKALVLRRILQHPTTRCMSFVTVAAYHCDLQSDLRCSCSLLRLTSIFQIKIQKQLRLTTPGFCQSSLPKGGAGDSTPQAW